MKKLILNYAKPYLFVYFLIGTQIIEILSNPDRALLFMLN